MPSVKSGSGGSQLRRTRIDVLIKFWRTSSALSAAWESKPHNTIRLSRVTPRRAAASSDSSSSVPPVDLIRDDVGNGERQHRTVGSDEVNDITSPSTAEICSPLTHHDVGGGQRPCDIVAHQIRDRMRRQHGGAPSGTHSRTAPVARLSLRGGHAACRCSPTGRLRPCPQRPGWQPVHALRRRSEVHHCCRWSRRPRPARTDRECEPLARPRRPVPRSQGRPLRARESR